MGVESKSAPRDASLARLQERAPGALFRTVSTGQQVVVSRSRPVLGRLAVAAIRGTARLPLRLLHSVGASLGLLVALLPTRERSITAVNLNIAFPDLDERARRRLLRQSLMHTGRAVCELGAMWCAGRDRIASFVREVRGEELISEALEQGQGVLIVAPHLGSWEMTCNVLTLKFGGTFLYRHLSVAEVDALVHEARARFGGQLIPTGQKALHRIVKALRRSELVGLMPDQDAGEGTGIFAPFFGLAANTGVLIPRLASRVDARVVFAHAERLPRGQGFRLHFEPAETELRDRNLERSASALNRQLEGMIRRIPEQYLWSYKRWRHRPPDESAPNPYRREQPGPGNSRKDS